MSFLAWRRQTLVAVALVLPLLVSAFAVVLPMHDHSCQLDKDCPLCRSAAETATELVSPSVDQTELLMVAIGLVFDDESTQDGQPQSIASRGPPPSA